MYVHLFVLEMKSSLTVRFKFPLYHRVSATQRSIFCGFERESRRIDLANSRAFSANDRLALAMSLPQFECCRLLGSLFVLGNSVGSSECKRMIRKRALNNSKEAASGKLFRESHLVVVPRRRLSFVGLYTWEPD